MNLEQIEIHAIFQGHVQGVGFRATARHLAMRLGIVGTVRNLADGCVELYSMGKKSAIQELIQELTNIHGPGPGKVSVIFSEEVNPHHQYTDFQILF